MEYQIYYVKCKANDKGYVGITSRSIKDRWSLHLEGAMNDITFRTNPIILDKNEVSYVFDNAIKGLLND